MYVVFQHSLKWNLNPSHRDKNSLMSDALYTVENTRGLTIPNDITSFTEFFPYSNPIVTDATS